MNVPLAATIRWTSAGVFEKREQDEATAREVLTGL